MLILVLFIDEVIAVMITMTFNPSDLHASCGRITKKD